MTSARGMSFETSTTFEDVRRRVDAFVEERDWSRFHTPRNIALALVGEVGELCELFQWRGEVAPGLPDWSDEDRTKLGEELSDVTIYTLRLADRCGIDLPSAVLRKIRLNAVKYPADKARGSARKYTAYESDRREFSGGAVLDDASLAALEGQTAAPVATPTHSPPVSPSPSELAPLSPGATSITSSASTSTRLVSEFVQESVLSVEVMLAFVMGVAFALLWVFGAGDAVRTVVSWMMVASK